MQPPGQTRFRPRWIGAGRSARHYGFAGCCFVSLGTRCLVGAVLPPSRRPRRRRAVVCGTLATPPPPPYASSNWGLNRKSWHAIVPPPLLYKKGGTMPNADDVRWPSVLCGRPDLIFARRGDGTRIERALRTSLDFDSDRWSHYLRCGDSSHDAGHHPLIARGLLKAKHFGTFSPTSLVSGVL